MRLGWKSLVLAGCLALLSPVGSVAQEFQFVDCFDPGVGAGCTNPIPAGAPGVTSGPMDPSTITVPPGCIRVLDLDVYFFASHTFRADLDVTLTPPGGAPIALFSDVGGGGNDFGIFLDSDAATNIATDCVDATPAPCSSTSTPETANALDAVDNASPVGVWTLGVVDDAGADSGALQDWGLIFTCPADVDDDLVEDTLDNCPAVANGDQADGDLDGVGSACDNCPIAVNNDQADGDGDAVGDACDPTVSPSTTFDCAVFGDGCNNSIPVSGNVGDMDPSHITIPPGACSLITDVDVTFAATHTFRADLIVRVTPPGGSPLALFSAIGSGANDFDITLDSDSLTPIATGCASSAPCTGAVAPEPDPQVLSTLRGTNAEGTWTLDVTDNAGADAGMLLGWGLIINCENCGNGVLNAGEQCEAANQTACPGRCQADCTCLACADVSDPKAKVTIKAKKDAGVLKAKETLPIATYAGEPVTVSLEDGGGSIASQAVGALTAKKNKFLFKSGADGVRSVLFSSKGGGTVAKVAAKKFFTAAGADEPAASTRLVIQVGSQCFSHPVTKKVD